jgi:hypothetical protein
VATSLTNESTTARWAASSDARSARAASIPRRVLPQKSQLPGHIAGEPVGIVGCGRKRADGHLVGAGAAVGGDLREQRDRATPTSARNSRIRATAVWRSRFCASAVRTRPIIVESRNRSSQARPATESGASDRGGTGGTAPVAAVSCARAAESESKNAATLSLDRAAPTLVAGGTGCSGW